MGGLNPPANPCGVHLIFPKIAMQDSQLSIVLIQNRTFRFNVCSWLRIVVPLLQRVSLKPSAFFTVVLLAVQPLKFFSVTTRSIGSNGPRACKLGLSLTLKHFGVCRVIMGVACIVSRAIRIFLLRRGEGKNTYGDYSHTFGATCDSIAKILTWIASV